MQCEIQKKSQTFIGRVLRSRITRPSSITDCIRDTALSVFLSISSSLIGRGRDVKEIRFKRKKNPKQEACLSEEEGPAKHRMVW